MTTTHVLETGAADTPTTCAAALSPLPTDAENRPY
jgi:hypothetical protein